MENSADDIIKEHKITKEKLEDNTFDDLYAIVNDSIGLDFAYNDLESMADAMYCLKELSDYEADDKGLWEGCKTYEEEINTRAYFTFERAIIGFIEGELE